MGYPTKIATCCYCGSRAALVLDKDRHELACSSCGAPLHNMKNLPQEPARRARNERPYRYPGEKPQEKKKSRKSYGYDAPRPKYRKKRKGLMRHFFEEAFDIIEDIID
ncbi:MAG: hypothetical protein WBV62_05465 [Roseobacter sp.]